MAGKRRKDEPTKEGTLKLNDVKETMENVRIIDKSIEKHPLRRDKDYTPAWRKPS